MLAKVFDRHAQGPRPTVNVTADEAGRIFHPAFESATEALGIYQSADEGLLFRRPPKSKSHRNEQEIHLNTWNTRELDLFGVTESLSIASKRKKDGGPLCLPNSPSAFRTSSQTPGVPSAAATPATFDLQSPKSDALFIDWYAPHLWQDFV